MKKTLIALLLSSFTVAVFSQAAAPEPEASAPKHKLWKKLKARHPAASATNPEASPDKKGGN